MSNLVFKGRKLKVSRAKKPKLKQTEDHYIKGATKIFVGGMPNEVSKEEFKLYFEQYGPIDDVCLPMKDKIRGINRGHGFINYVYSYSAQLAVEQYDKHQIRAKWVI